MIVVSYDISNDRKRNAFSKYLSRFGHRLQYSVFEIENSERILNNIITELNNSFIREFDEEDSIYIFKMNPNCEIYKYGFASHEDDEMIIVT